MKKFPGTKAEFDKWWKGKHDIYKSYARSTTCPIARFLKYKGIEEPHVGGIGHWYSRSLSLERYPLPRWAVNYISRFDKVHQGG